MVKTTTTTKVVGAMDECNKLGVHYNHMYQVLKGTRESVALVLKINRLCPSLFNAPYCEINYKEIVKKNKDKYKWDSKRQRYRKVWSD
jgi:hypothetical protein